MRADPSKPRWGRALAVGLGLLAVGPDAALAPSFDWLVSRGGVVGVRATDPGVPGGATLPALGDFVLSSSAVSVVIGARSRGGGLLRATSSVWADDELGEVRPAVELDGELVALPPSIVAPVGAEPEIRIEHEPVSGVVASTVIRVSAGEPHVELETTLRNDGVRSRRVAGGDVARWPGGAVFVPGRGIVRRSGRAPAPWVGRRGERQRYVLAPEGGGGEVVLALAGADPHDDSAALVGPERELAVGAAVTYRRRLFVGWRRLADVGALAWRWSGVPVGRVTGHVEPVPAWATITALATGRVVMERSVDTDGSFVLDLPAGAYEILARAPGGSESRTVRVDPEAPPVRVELHAPLPGTLRYFVTDPRGRPSPARLLIRGARGTPDPVLGTAQDYRGAKFAVYTASGVGDLELPEGDYVVTVGRGPEHSQVDHPVRVTRARGATLRAIVERLVETPGWLGGDFHLHASPSPDSDVGLESRVTSLLAEGVEIAVATDHDRVTDYGPVVRAMGFDEQLATAPGSEVTTGSWGHFNVYPLPPSQAPFVHRGLAPQELFASLRRAVPAAIVQVNHPWMGSLGYFRRTKLGAKGEAPEASRDFDVIEVINGFELESPTALDTNLGQWFALLEQGHRFGAVGNSDSHRIDSQWAGYPRTWVRVDRDEPGSVTIAEVTRALARGRAVVSTGPFVELLVDGAGPGEVVVPGRPLGPARLDVQVLAPPWMDVARAEIVVGGVVLHAVSAGATDRGSTLRLQTSVGVRALADTWVVVVVRGAAPADHTLPDTKLPPFAFTNPVWLDVGGDGYRRIKGGRSVIVE